MNGLTRRTSLTLLAGVTALLLASPGAIAENLGIHVSGAGFVDVEPDMGHVTLQVRREGSDAAALKKELDAVVSGVLEVTDALDIDRKDVTAAMISINPRYQRRGNDTVVDGLVATRTITIRLRDLADFGELMNRSLAQGVNNVDPIRLDSSQRESLENEALNLAMRDALDEAARVAAGFGVSRGEVIDVHVSAHTPRPQMAARAMMAEAAGGDAFSPGVIRIERHIQVTFAIDD